MYYVVINIKISRSDPSLLKGIFSILQVKYVVCCWQH